MFLNKILKMIVSTAMALVMTVTTSISGSLHTTARAATTDVTERSEAKQETVTADSEKENTLIRVTTTYQSFTITSSSGKYAVMEGGEKVKGDLNISDAIGFEGSSLTRYDLEAEGGDEWYTIVPTQTETEEKGGFYYTEVLNTGNYFAWVGSASGAALTVDKNGTTSTKIDSGVMVNQKVTSYVGKCIISVEGKSSNFTLETTDKKTKITSAEETEAIIRVAERENELILGTVPIDKNGITVFEEGSEYVITDANGTEIARADMGYYVGFISDRATYADGYSNVQKDALIPEPQQPIRDGYTFKGWYTNDKFTEESKWDFNTDKVTESMTLYAKWTKKTLPQTKSVTAKNKSKESTNVTWKKVSGAKGYEIKYSTNKKFTSKTTKTVKVKNELNTQLTKLKKGKTYYIKVRAYKKDGTATVYGKYSAVKKVKITK